MKEWLNLYEAIWAEGIREDIKNLIELLYKNAYRNAYEYYSLNATVQLEFNDEKFNNFKADIKEYCTMKCKKLTSKMKEWLYEEAQEWPGNKDYKKSTEYKEELKKLKEETKEYAIERMSKRMRYLT